MRLFNGNKAVRSLTASLLGLLFAVAVSTSFAQVPAQRTGGYDPQQNLYLPGSTAQFMNVNGWSFPGCFAPGTTVTLPIASPGIVNVPNTCIAGQQVFFNTTGALPTGLTAGTTYYVIATGLTASGFEVSTSAGGSASNFTGTQSGIQYANSNYANATTSFTAAITTAPLPPQTTVPLHCSLIWQTSNTTGTIEFGLSLNNAASSAVVMNTAHYGAGGATLADLYTLVPASASFATPTAISAATTATAANTSYRDDVDILLTSTTLPTTVSINALSSSASYTIALMPGSKCIVGY